MKKKNNMTDEQRKHFIELKRKQVNDFDYTKINYFQKILKPKFFIPYTVEDIENITSINFQFCKTKEEKNDYLTLIHLQSVFDGKNLGSGRNIPIIVKTNDKILGVMRITSSGRLSKSVDDFIGWDEDTKWHGKTGGIQKLGYAQALVPSQPFGFNCLGGKLLAMLSISKDVTDFWYNKYNSPLYGMMTLSMAAGVTQYDGLKYFKRIGETKSNRGVYFASMYDNTKLLLNETEIDISVDKRLTSKQIIQEWKSKAIKRFQKLQIEGRLKMEIETYDYLYQRTKSPFFDTN